MKKSVSFVCALLALNGLFAQEFKREKYIIDRNETALGSEEAKMLHYNKYGYMIWEGSSWYGGKTYDTIVIDGKYNYQFFEIPFMKQYSFAYKTVEKDSAELELDRIQSPARIAFVENIKASSVLKDRNYTYGVENIVFPCRNGEYVQNLPWAEGKAGAGIGESIEFDVMSVYKAYSDGAGRKEVNGSIMVSILNGFVNPSKQQLFYENNRIKRASVYVDGKKYLDLNFRDVVEYTDFEIPGDAQHVKIVIEEVYKGTKHDDTCVTKLDVFYYMNFLD